MANTVFQHKRSGTPANVPSTLELGEIAINYADGLIFYKNTTGHIVSISSGGNSFGTINANGTLVVADTPSDVLNLLAGNNVTFGVDTVNDKITINSSGGDVSPVFNAANAAFANGNTNFGIIQSAFGQANTARDQANSAFEKANLANNLTVANTGVVVGSRNVLNFVPGGNVVITFADDAVGNRVNVSISAVGGGGGDISAVFNVANAAYNQANTALAFALIFS